MVAAPARAEHRLGHVCENCGNIEGIIGNLKDDLAFAEDGDGNLLDGRIIDSLERKLDDVKGALSKLAAAKYCDAAKKLDQFRNRICDMKQPNNKGVSKIDETDAGDFIDCASVAINCICILAENECYECPEFFSCP